MVWASNYPVGNSCFIGRIPAYSPELQPAERLWPLINEPIANRSFETLEDLEQALFQRCQVLLEQQVLIRQVTYYHWWPQTSA
ncbi:hypothetical protein [Nostoc favosum]|uniref:hypothetical protein n=1 Tax=Nostoc favosum TaxID=2907819 RepID=UPI003F68AFDD